MNCAHSLEGVIVTVGELAGRGSGGGVSMGWRVVGAAGVISWRCSAAHLHVGCADLGHAGSLSKYLHANWCYLIHLSVKRFHNFKN